MSYVVTLSVGFSDRSCLFRVHYSSGVMYLQRVSELGNIDLGGYTVSLDLRTFFIGLASSHGSL